MKKKEIRCGLVTDQGLNSRLLISSIHSNDKKMDFLLSNDHNFPVVYSLQSQKAISYLIVCKSHYILSLVFSYSRTPLYKSLITWGTLLPQTLREVSSNITLRDLTRNLRPAFLHHWSTSCCKHHIAIVQNTLWEKCWGFGSPCIVKKIPLLLSEVAKKIRPLLLSRVASPRIPRR